MPKVSIVIPAYNSAKYIKETLESILNQTFTDYECLVINDASTDSTVEIVESFIKKDKRFKLLNNKYEKGIVGGLNTGFDEATGEYIVRIDSDDIAFPERIKIQVDYMDRNLDTAVLGSAYEMFGTYIGPRYMPQDFETIKITMLFYGAIAHPTTIIRKSVIDKYKFRYDVNFIWAEDLDLWLRISKVAKLENLPNILLKYRTHEASVGSVYNEKQQLRVKEMHLREFNLLGINPTESEISLHEKVASWNFENTSSFLIEVADWFNKIVSKNKSNKIYDQNKLIFFLTNKLFDICKSLKPLKWSDLVVVFKFFILDKNLNLDIKLKLFLKVFYIKLKYKVNG